jgi:hypothetical protein
LKYIDAYTFLCSLYWDIFWGFTLLAAKNKKAEKETNKMITKTQRNLRETIVRKAKSVP